MRQAFANGFAGTSSERQTGRQRTRNAASGRFRPRQAACICNELPACACQDHDLVGPVLRNAVGGWAFEVQQAVACGNPTLGATT
jgi:hypothetical protein